VTGLISSRRFVLSPGLFAGLYKADAIMWTELLAQCCPHAREIFWAGKGKSPIRHVNSSHVRAKPPCETYLVNELEEYRQALQKWTGKTILDEDIDKAIEIHNINRRLMLSIYDLMKSPTQQVAAPEVSEIALAGMLIDKQVHNHLLQAALDELRKRPASGRQGPRLMLLGSVNNDIELIKFIDSLGGRVVIDDYCTGNRYYQIEVVPEENRLVSLASRLIEKPPCPLKDIPERRRVAHLAKLANDYRVQGVIYTIQRLCDSHGLDYPAIDSAFKALGIPMLKLELDYTAPIGQFRTRIEAFLEMIEVSNN
jgi:benzoyl-CoA reductase subunit C